VIVESPVLRTATHQLSSTGSGPDCNVTPVRKPPTGSNPPPTMAWAYGQLTYQRRAYFAVIDAEDET
jgi:hypothetical protein